MSKFILIWIFLLPALGFAQVGIGTISPDRALHVSGENTTIRIDSLSKAKNNLNKGNELTPVYVQKNGNLTLLPTEDRYTPIKIINAHSTFSTEVLATNPMGTASTTTSIYTYNFTLPAQSTMEVRYSMAYRVFESYLAGTGVRIFDGQSRHIKTYFTVNTNPDPHGQISQNYYNMSTVGAAGIFYNNGFGYINLPAGNHTLTFYIDIAGSTNNETAVLLGGGESLLRLRFY